ncbi:erythromycin esterase family protein [Saccharopolyspora sp. NPDC050389]|uniref:erythromycin esterase family protein n=1 Tax=Saccharopolyspora sp. NPDC050389 TaxID=3155516 RepID=UPI0033CDB977
MRGWVRDRAVRASLDPDAPLDDLEPLRDVIGDARVVGIGESTHHASEFYRLRHRLLRFLAERCGFTAYVFEAPFTEAHVIDDWVRGGPGDVAEVSGAGTALGLGDCPEMHAHLTWMRRHNEHAERPLRFVGALPVSTGSLLPALTEVERFLRRADPDALPLLTQATEVAERFDGDSLLTFQRYAELDAADRSAATAALSRLLARMECMAAHHRSEGRGGEHAAAMRHLRSAWHLDHFQRDLSGAGLAVGTAELDRYAAETALHLLGEEPRIVFALHNTHLRRTPIAHEGAFGLFPAGYHLAEALGDDYVAIAATSIGGRAVQGRLNLDHPDGVETREVPLPLLEPGCIETAFTGDAPLTIAELRPEIEGADAYRRIRTEGGFMEAPIFKAFNAIACVPTTTTWRFHP